MGTCSREVRDDLCVAMGVNRVPIGLMMPGLLRFSRGTPGRPEGLPGFVWSSRGIVSRLEEDSGVLFDRGKWASPGRLEELSGSN